MKRWFVLAQGPQAAELDCYEVRDDKIIPHGYLRVEDLQKQAGMDPVVIAMTAHLWTCVDLVLPAIKPALLYKALPHMVEDAVLSPADEIHCALPQGYTPGEACTVLVMAQATVQGWVDWALAHGLNIQALIPAYTLLPIMSGHMGMMLYHDTLWIRYTHFQGYCVPMTLARSMWDKLITHEHVDLYGEMDQDIKEKLSCIHPQMLRLQDCLLQADTFTVNFLQGHFKPRKHKDKTQRRPMILTLGLCLTALMVHIIYLGVSHVVLSSRLSAFKLESLALYQKAYPDATSVTSPKTLITRALGQGSAGSNVFAETLSALAQATVTHPLHIQQIEYRDKHLVVMGSVGDFTQVEGLIQMLKDKGYVAEQQKAQQAEGKVDISLLIARGAQ